MDESGINKCLVRERGRAIRGIKIEDVKRGKKFQRVNVVAGQFKDINGKTHRIAPLCYTENMNSELFENWFKKKLVNSVSRGSTIIMDRASFHRKKKLANLARRHGVKVLFLPAYSPDLNPIKKTWANMKKALIDILPHTDNLQMAVYDYFAVSIS